MSRATVRRALSAGMAALVLVSLSSSAVAGAQSEPAEVQRHDVGLVTNGGRSVHEGDSSTRFLPDLPEGAECPGDSKDGQYRVYTYMVPEDVDPATVPFAGAGPEPQAYGDREAFRMPLFDEYQAAITARMTMDAAEKGGPGKIMELPLADLRVYEPGYIPDGTYNVGIACTWFDQVTTYWNTRITVTADPADEPAGIRWAVVGADGEGSGAQPSPAPLLAGAGAVVLALGLRWRSRRTRTPRKELT